MLFYFLYTLIFNNLLYLINVKEIYLLVINLFDNVNNNYFFLGIFIGIFFKLIYFSIKKFKDKRTYKYALLSLLDIFKILFISYNIYLIILGLVISLILKYFLKNNYISSNLIKLLLIIIYIFTPILIIFILNSIYNKNDLSEVLLSFEVLVFIILFKPFELINVSIKTMIGFIIIFLFTFNTLKKSIKKRNIILIFLLIITLIYYSVIS
ncbi:MAG: hypothetical protein J5634_00875 [Bacilli bacterium]|nr:hypothetical protein [Bacilli bacterium]